jgi:hypothetical protein
VQYEIIKNKYEEIKNNDELLKTIAKNGLDWYVSNGSIRSNVEILKNVIILEKLL